MNAPTSAAQEAAPIDTLNPSPQDVVDQLRAAAPYQPEIASTFSST